MSLNQSRALSRSVRVQQDPFRADSRRVGNNGDPNALLGDPSALLKENASACTHLGFALSGQDQHFRSLLAYVIPTGVGIRDVERPDNFSLIRGCPGGMDYTTSRTHWRAPALQ
jgi:hypothetical protein